MLRGPLLHPEILEAIAGAGHSAKILVADANYPFTTVASPGAKRVFLNLSPGVVDVPTVVEALNKVLPFEAVEVNVPDDGSESEVVGIVRNILGDIPLTRHKRFAFYDAARSEDVFLVIATGETRIYSCALLTIGYIPG